MTLLLAILLAQAAPIPTDKEAEAVARRLREDFANAGLEKKSALVAEALEGCPHEKVIKAVGEILASEAEPVRISAAQSLAAVDHPASAEALTAAIAPNQRRIEVVTGILKAIGDLGWQSPSAALHELLRQIGNADVREFMPLVLETLGKLGNPASIDPICDLVIKFEGPRKDPWPNEGAIRRRAEEALREISGAQFRKAEEYKSWWRSSSEIMKGRSQRVFWSKKTHERIQVGPADKAPADTVLLSIRITEPKEDRRAPKPKKKR